MSLSFLPTLGLSYDQAEKLATLIAGLLADLGIVRTITTINIDEQILWLLSKPITEPSREWLLANIKMIMLFAHATYIGATPLSFYCAQKLKLRPVDYHKHCLTFDPVLKDSVSDMMQFLQYQGYDGIWGPVPELQSEKKVLLPFTLVTEISTVEIITIVKWQTKHYMTATEYYQYYLRGMTAMGTNY